MWPAGRLATPAMVCLALVVCWAGPALGAGDATLNAVLYRPIPTGEPIHVRALDNSPDQEQLKRQFEAALVSRGIAIRREPANLVLTLQPQDQTGFWSYRSGALIEAQRGYNELARKDLDSYTVNLYDSSKGGLINKPGRAEGINRSRYRLEARLEERSSGRTLWQGWTTAELQYGDGQTLLRSMVPALADSVGETVREQTVDLR